MFDIFFERGVALAVPVPPQIRACNCYAPMMYTYQKPCDLLTEKFEIFF